MDFKSYYNTKFREDLYRFFSTIPDESKYHEDRENKLIFSIQFERLKPTYNHLNFLEKEEKEYFGVALFFTVLIDMVCFTYFKNHYGKFQLLTRYPKLIGNCLSWCRFHLHPRDIFQAMNRERPRKFETLIFKLKFLEAAEIMKIETADFFTEYLNDIDSEEFWLKCSEEFPY